MARVSIYLNFMGNTEEAFQFYRSVFNTEFEGPITYMRDMPADPNRPALPEHEQGKVVNVALPILGGTVLMGTDYLESMGHQLRLGNNVHINLEPDTRAEGERLFNALADGGSISMPLMPMFWGDLFGSCTDQYGIHWMVNCPQA